MDDWPLDTTECFWGRKGKYHNSLGNINTQQLLKNCYSAKYSNGSREPAFLPQQCVAAFACIPFTVRYPGWEESSCRLVQTLQPQSMLSSQELNCLSWETPARHSHRRFIPQLVLFHCVRPTHSLLRSCVGLFATTWSDLSSALHSTVPVAVQKKKI